MELIKPGLGLVFWMIVSFGIVFLLLKKFAWKPILKALKEREDSIEDAIQSAQKAKEEIALLKSDNEKLLHEARQERDLMLKDAREVKDSIIAEAKLKASAEAEKHITNARETIRNEKLAAITELKNQVASMSIEIAEKIIRHEIATDEKQKALMSSLIEEINMN